MPDFSTDTTFLGDLFGGGQTYDLPIDWSALFGGAWPEYMSDPGLASVMGGEQMYFDTQTGQVVTLAQAQAIDPTFNPEGAISQTPTGMFSGGGGLSTGISGVEPSTPQTGVNLPTGTQTQQQLSTLAQILGIAPGALSALAGLGMLGGAGAALFGGGNQPGTATQTSTTTPSALQSPQVQQLLGSTGTIAPGGAGGAPGAYTGGTGLQGAAGQAAANLQGPQGLLQGQIGAIPQLNPAIQAAIGQNALGFSRGEVPTLANPQAQQYFQNMLGGQNAAVDYQTANALTDAIQQLRARGFAGGSEIFRQGAPAAAMGPILAQANAQKAMNLGNINAQQLGYATALPQLGANLNAAQLGAQAVPFSAYTSALGAQSQIPQALLAALLGQGGSTSTATATGPTPSLLQTLGQITPLLGAAGGLLNSPSVSGSQGIPGLGVPATPGLFDRLSGLFG